MSDLFFFIVGILETCQNIAKLVHIETGRHGPTFEQTLNALFNFVFDFLWIVERLLRIRVDHVVAVELRRIDFMGLQEINVNAPNNGLLSSETTYLAV